MGTIFSERYSDNEHKFRPWHHRAFIVEALILLVFLMSSLAVLVLAMGETHERGKAAEELSCAVILATNDAEAFAADPQSETRLTWFYAADGTLMPVESTTSGELGDGHGLYQVTRDVKQEARQAGTLHRAHITVAYDGVFIYELNTSRYVSNEGEGT